MVLKLGLPPKYVLDEMEFYEISALIKYQYLKDKESWEQARMLGFVTARSNGSKIKKMEDLMKFHWEKKQKTKEPVFMSEEQMKNYRDKSKWIIENNILNE